jgi:hypothetical protein
MIYNGKEIEFPAVMQVSFYKLIETLQEMAKDKDQARANYAKELLTEVDNHPELRDGIEDLDLLHKLQKPIERITKVLFPDALLTNEIKVLTPPFDFKPMVTTTRLDNISKASGEEFSYKMKDIDDDTFYLFCCHFILGSYHGYPIPGGGSMKMEIFNQNQGLTRIYKMLINADMLEFIPTEKAIDLSQKDIEELIDNSGNLELWKKKFPPNSWIMKGVTLITLVDITLDHSIEMITSNLLVKSTDAFDKISSGMRSLLNNANLEMGMLLLDDNKLVPMNKEQITSILLGADESLSCGTDLCEYVTAQLFQKNEPIVISDIKSFHEKSNSGLSKNLAASKFNSYIIVPLIHEEELLGFMELGAPERYELNQSSLRALDAVIPVLSMAHKRFMIEEQNHIEAIIQQECTTIHHSVKWRFEQEAEKFMEKQLRNEQPIFKDIIFNNLYPLYGQMDIKGSSVKRNKAVSADLIKQINGINKVLKYAFKQTKMVAYEELIFRLETYKAEFKKELSAGSEHRLLSFLQTDIYPVFDHLRDSDTNLKKLVDQYRDMLDNELNTVYEERKKYDTSVNQINQKLASYLDEKQLDAQKIFPHYFERYKTDGVEYNIYIGQSITNDNTFDKIYLRNLRIWQLVVMCEMENEFQSMQKDLHTPVEIASLILVYSTPLSVHFRMDEKRFDVEGAYNARYEIIKKRVDKAHIKGTQERITRPGSIAIIYSQDSDAREYREYLHFLAEKGYLKKGFEDVELEDLQGVTGLRALRVEVAYSGGLSIDEIIEAIEQRVQ